MKYSEIKLLAEGVAPVVREVVDKLTAPLMAENKGLTDRLAALEKRLDGMPSPKDGRDGAPGADGKSITIDDVAPLIIQEVEKAVAAIPAAKDGEQGTPGCDADPDVVAALVHERIKEQLNAMQRAVEGIPEAPELPDITAMIAEAVAAIPAPKSGDDGKSVAVEDVLPALQEEMRRFLETVPLPKDGEPGKDGKDGRDGADGKNGAPGEKGADGIGLAGALIDRDGGLVVTLTNGEAKALGAVVGHDGLPGRDGAHGIGFEDLSFEIAETGRAVARFQRGDVVKTIALPGIVDRGTFADGEIYDKGDAVSWGGSLWIAQENGVKGKPGEGEAWRLAVKKGRDGRDTEARRALP